jgi:hypothetical protein
LDKSALFAGSATARRSTSSLGVNLVSAPVLTPNCTLLLCVGVVAASTVVLPWVGGYGTVLFQLVALGAWGLLAAITSDVYADLHHGWLWLIALFLNLLFFLVPAVLWWLVTRRRWPSTASVGLVAWCAVYLSFLFIFWRATDGP